MPLWCSSPSYAYQLYYGCLSGYDFVTEQCCDISLFRFWEGTVIAACLAVFCCASTAIYIFVHMDKKFREMRNK